MNKSLKIAVVVNAAGKYYLGVIQNLTKEKKQKSETTTAECLNEAMEEKWKIYGGNDNNDDGDNGNKTVLG